MTGYLDCGPHWGGRGNEHQTRRRLVELRQFAAASAAGTFFERSIHVLSAFFRNPLAIDPAPDGIIGRYSLVRPLGIGGMAEVFEAQASGPAGFARTVVIKRILPAYSRDSDFRRMFIDEAKILGMMHHPNVVQVYDFGEHDDGTLFLALELVDGPSISHLLRRLRANGRKLPPGIAAYIAREVCRALDYVHTLTDAEGESMQIVHRDVSPSNIMLTSGGAVKLLDFGVAKSVAARQKTKAGTVKGKPAYLAPEQVEGKPIDGRVDLFAVGVVLHEMLTLEHLFAGDSELATLRKILQLEVPVPSAKRQDVPAELDRIVLRALERDPDRRYPDAAQMARELDEFVITCGIGVQDVAAFMRDVDLHTGGLLARPAAVACGLAVFPDAGDAAREKTVSELTFADPTEVTAKEAPLRLAWRRLEDWCRTSRSPGPATRWGVSARRALMTAGVALALAGAGTAAYVSFP